MESIFHSNFNSVKRYWVKFISATDFNRTLERGLRKDIENGSNERNMCLGISYSKEKEV